MNAGRDSRKTVLLMKLLGMNKDSIDITRSLDLKYEILFGYVVRVAGVIM